MRTTAIFLLLTSLLTLVFSTILTPLFDENDQPIMLNPDAQLDQTFIENALNSDLLHDSPQNYEPFIEMLFVQPFFHFDAFKFMIDNNMVPLNTAHVAFHRFNSMGEEELRYYDDMDRDIFEELGQILVKYFQSFDGFQEEFVHICQRSVEEEENHMFLVRLLQFVEVTQGDFKKCINNELFARHLFADIISFGPGDNEPFCMCSLIEADWFTPSDLVDILRVFDAEIHPQVLESIKTKLVNLDTTVEFIEKLETVGSQHNAIVRWIVAQPWVTTDLIEQIIEACDVTDTQTLETELIMHAKASFECIINIKLDKFQLSGHMISQVLPRMAALVKEGASKEEVFEYIVGIPQENWARNGLAQPLVQNIILSVPEYFYPAQQCFTEIFKVFDHNTHIFDIRRPIFALVYLYAFKAKLTEEDLDHIVSFLFTCRPLELSDDFGIWISVAEKIATISFRHAMTMVNMAKTDHNLIFGEVHDITNYIAQLAITSKKQSIEELKGAYRNPIKYIGMMPYLGKYEKVFLMLMAPRLSGLFYCCLKNLDPNYIFMDNVNELVLKHQETLKESSKFIVEAYPQIIEANNNSTLAMLTRTGWEKLMSAIGNVCISYEHREYMSMIESIATIVLASPELTVLPLSAEDQDLLRKILASRDAILKRNNPDSANEEDPEAKRQRTN